jgi:PhoPQ-activated pathogenicity-related protein
MVGITECSTCVKVSAIIPLVPIEPNLLKDIHRQWQSYGGWTFAFNDYTEAGVMQWLDDEIFGSME